MLWMQTSLARSPGLVGVGMFSQPCRTHGPWDVRVAKLEHSQCQTKPPPVTLDARCRFGCFRRSTTRRTQAGGTPKSGAQTPPSSGASTSATATGVATGVGHGLADACGPLLVAHCAWLWLWRPDWSLPGSCPRSPVIHAPVCIHHLLARSCRWCCDV